MGGSGVQRPLKFAKYLRDHGWNPIILCPEPGAYQFFDDTLEKELNSLELEIHRVKANTPFHKLGGGKKKTGLISGTPAKVLRNISRKIYFPDNKKGWIEPAVIEAEKLIKNKKIDLIFSTAPPFSNHIVAQKLNQLTNIPFVVDYRDLFSGNHFEVNESDSKISQKLKLESKWLTNSSGVIALDEFALKKIQEVIPSKSLQAKVISHGFDLDDFKADVKSILDYKKDKLNWLYSGLFYESNQPDVFLKGLNEAFNRNVEMKEKTHLHFQGGLDSRIRKLIQQLGMESIVSDYGYIAHNISVANLKKADVLWMISDFSENLQQIKTGKLFEYIGTRKPILGLVHYGETSELLNEYKVGYHASPNKIQDVSIKIEEMYELWKHDKFPEPSNKYVEKFDRRKLTGELATFFNEIVKK